MIRINVFVRIAEHSREEFLRTARELVAASLGEVGCEAYDLFESTTRPDVLLICETWRDAEALKAHETAPHFTSLVPRLRELGEMTSERFEF